MNEDNLKLAQQEVENALKAFIYKGFNNSQLCKFVLIIKSFVAIPHFSILWKTY